MSSNIKFCLCFCSSDESPDSSNTSSSIVFQSFSQDAAASAKVSPGETESVRALVPAQQTGQMVCPKTMHRIPENYVPCVFLGQKSPMNSSRCPAMDWDSSALLEGESSMSSIELNNNSCIDKECKQWADECTAKPSKDVGV